MAEISIVIPIYNAEKYLRECLDSAVNQTMRDIEIILVDDGSTDTSGTICDEYAERDCRIRVIHKANGGVCDARNVGMYSVDTEYFTFLESDDWLPIDACQKMLQKSRDNTIDFVIGTYYKVATNGISIKKPLDDKLVTFDEEEIKNNLLSYILGLTGERLKKPSTIDTFLTDTAKLYKTNIVKENNLTWISRKVIYSDCLDFIIKYANKCKSAVYFDEPLYYYRRTNENSQTATHRPRTVEMWLYQFDELKKFIRENKLENLYPAFYSRICFSIIPIGGNAYRRRNLKDAINEIKQALTNPIYREAFKNFPICELPIHFRPLFFFAKHRWYCSFYFMTVVMRKIMNKQRGL